MEKKKTVHKSITDHPDTSSEPARKKKNSLIIGMFLAVVFAVSGSGAYYLLQYQKSQELHNNPAKAAEIEYQNLVAAVGKLMELPKDEVPTIAKVSDITKLADQPFFVKAKNGDRVLIYPQAKQAILYDPEANKIINVGPIAAAQESTAIAGASTTGQSENPTKSPVRVALYNGTTEAGLARRIGQEIAQKMSSVAVVEQTNASAFTYTSILVIDLSGKNSLETEQIATHLQGRIEESLPPGERDPVSADILVILGRGDR